MCLVRTAYLGAQEIKRGQAEEAPLRENFLRVEKSRNLGSLEPGEGHDDPTGPDTFCARKALEL